MCRSRTNLSTAPLHQDSALESGQQTIAPTFEQQDEIPEPKHQATIRLATGFQPLTSVEDDSDIENGRNETNQDDATILAPGTSIDLLASSGGSVASRVISRRMGNRTDKGKAKVSEPDDEDAIINDEEDDLEDGDQVEIVDGGADEDEEADYQPISARLRRRTQPTTLAASTTATANGTTQTAIAQPTTLNQATAVSAGPSTAVAAANPTVNNTAAHSPGAPQNALGLDEHFVLGRPRPAGALVPTNRAMTSFKWVPRRGAVDFNSTRSVEMLNRWKQQLVRRACRRLGIVRDARATRSH